VPGLPMELERLARNLFRYKLKILPDILQRRDGDWAETRAISCFSGACEPDPAIAKHFELACFEALSVEFAPKIDWLIFKIVQPAHTDVGVFTHGRDNDSPNNFCKA